MQSTRASKRVTFIRDALVLLAVGLSITLVGTTLLFIASVRDTQRPITNLGLPLIVLLASATGLLLLGGAPYYLGRRRLPWPALWALSIVACLILIGTGVFAISVASDVNDTSALGAAAAAVPLVLYTVSAIPIAELVLRKVEKTKKIPVR